MKKAAFATMSTLLFTGSVWASSHSYPRPGFDSLVSDGQVAIGDTKVDENAEVTSTDASSDSSSGDTSAVSNGFSVRLISIYRSKKSRAKIEASTKKTVLAASDADQNYTIQLSSYLTEAEGKSALQEFQNGKTPQAWMATAQVAGKTRYRIYYGHFKTLGQAQAARAQVIQESGIREAFVQKVFGKLTAKND